MYFSLFQVTSLLVNNTTGSRDWIRNIPGLSDPTDPERRGGGRGRGRRKEREREGEGGRDGEREREGRGRGGRKEREGGRERGVISPSCGPT